MTKIRFIYLNFQIELNFKCAGCSLTKTFSIYCEVDGAVANISSQYFGRKHPDQAIRLLVDSPIKTSLSQCVKND